MGGARCSTSFKSIYTIPVIQIGGGTSLLKTYSEKVMLITNVASHCGLTNRSYSDFIQLEKEFESKGLQILAFPCNQFMNQEPGKDEEILNFVRQKGGNFPVFSKVEVNGNNACELFKYLRVNSSLKGSSIGWNFGKFLIGREEKSVEYFGPTVMPLDIKDKIRKIL